MQQNAAWEKSGTYESPMILKPLLVSHSSSSSSGKSTEYGDTYKIKMEQFNNLQKYYFIYVLQEFDVLRNYFYPTV